MSFSATDCLGALRMQKLVEPVETFPLHLQSREAPARMLRHIRAGQRAAI